MNFIDIHVGQYLRARRRILGVSAEDVAKSLRITTTELGERESGRVRFSAVALQAICNLLRIRPSEIYAGLERPNALLDQQSSPVPQPSGP